MKLMLIAATLVSLNVSANEPRGGVEISQETYSKVTFTFNGPVREYNEILYKTQNDAAMYCYSRGMRLPTIREMVALAKAHGAEGILEESQVDRNKLIIGSMGSLQGVQSIATETWASGCSGGKKDHFYYSSLGYRHSAVAEGKKVWTNDLYNYSSRECTRPIAHVAFNGATGLAQVEVLKWESRNPFLCVKQRQIENKSKTELVGP